MLWVRTQRRHLNVRIDGAEPRWAAMAGNPQGTKVVQWLQQAKRLQLLCSILELFYLVLTLQGNVNCCAGALQEILHDLMIYHLQKSVCV